MERKKQTRYFEKQQSMVASMMLRCSAIENKQLNTKVHCRYDVKIDVELFVMFNGVFSISHYFMERKNSFLRLFLKFYTAK